MTVTADLMPPVLRSTTLSAVLAGRQLIWHIPDFAAAEYCARVVEAIRSVEFSPYPATVDVPNGAPVFKVGPTISDYFGTDFDAYFAEAEDCSRRLSACFDSAGVRHPLDVLAHLLSQKWDGPVAIQKRTDVPTSPESSVRSLVAPCRTSTMLRLRLRNWRSARRKHRARSCSTWPCRLPEGRQRCSQSDPLTKTPHTRGAMPPRPSPAQPLAE